MEQTQAEARFWENLANEKPWTPETRTPAQEAFWSQWERWLAVEYWGYFSHFEAECSWVMMRPWIEQLSYFLPWVRALPARYPGVFVSPGAWASFRALVAEKGMA